MTSSATTRILGMISLAAAAALFGCPSAEAPSNQAAEPVIAPGGAEDEPAAGGAPASDGTEGTADCDALRSLVQRDGRDAPGESFSLERTRSRMGTSTGMARVTVLREIGAHGVDAAEAWENVVPLALSDEWVVQREALATLGAIAPTRFVTWASEQLRSGGIEPAQQAAIAQALGLVPDGVTALFGLATSSLPSEVEAALGGLERALDRPASALAMARQVRSCPPAATSLCLDALEIASVLAPDEAMPGQDTWPWRLAALRSASDDDAAARVAWSEAAGSGLSSEALAWGLDRLAFRWEARWHVPATVTLLSRADVSASLRNAALDRLLQQAVHVGLEPGALAQIAPEGLRSDDLIFLAWVVQRGALDDATWARVDAAAAPSEPVDPRSVSARESQRQARWLRAIAGRGEEGAERMIAAPALGATGAPRGEATPPSDDVRERALLRALRGDDPAALAQALVDAPSGWWRAAVAWGRVHDDHAVALVNALRDGSDGDRLRTIVALDLPPDDVGAVLGGLRPHRITVADVSWLKERGQHAILERLHASALEQEGSGGRAVATLLARASEDLQIPRGTLAAWATSVGTALQVERASDRRLWALDAIAAGGWTAAEARALLEGEGAGSAGGRLIATHVLATACGTDNVP